MSQDAHTPTVRGPRGQQDGHRGPRGQQDGVGRLGRSGGFQEGDSGRSSGSFLPPGTGPTFPLPRSLGPASGRPGTPFQRGGSGSVGPAERSPQTRAVSLLGGLQWSLWESPCDATGSPGTWRVPVEEAKSDQLASSQHQPQAGTHRGPSNRSRPRQRCAQRMIPSGAQASHEAGETADAGSCFAQNCKQCHLTSFL